jgi:hypothetical protein
VHYSAKSKDVIIIRGHEFGTKRLNLAGSLAIPNKSESGNF